MSRGSNTHWLWGHAVDPRWIRVYQATGRGSTQPLHSPAGISFCSVQAGYKKGFPHRTSQRSMKTMHTAACACMCMYLHHCILCQDVPLSCTKVADPAGRTLSFEIAPCCHLTFQLKMALYFFLAAGIRLVLISSWSEFSRTVAFQLLRLLGFCMVSLSSVNKHRTRNIAGAYSLPLLAAAEAFSRCMVQAKKPFVNALPLSLNTVCIYQKGRPLFLFLCLILDFK